jgi:predicted ATPase
MVDITLEKGSLTGLREINLLVGRNGTGKSRLLRHIDSQLRGKPNEYYCLIINPERSGFLKIEPNVESWLTNPNWIHGDRDKNQSAYFRPSALSRLKEVRNSFYQRLESDNSLRYSDKTFNSEYINDVNNLLFNIQLENTSSGFKFRSIEGMEIAPENLSSGESEIVSLASEILYFFEQCRTDKANVLLLDEPDVHLHPDLQMRLIRFVERRLERIKDGKDYDISIVIASHSSALLGAIAEREDTTIGVKQAGIDVVKFKPTIEALKRTAPFFAHPLSSIFNLEFPLLIEGEDDERVWQQASRSAQGRIKLFPCPADSVHKLHDLECFLAEVLPAFYDEPKAYSIRDGDRKVGVLESIGCIRRFRLDCYAIENALLTNDVLGRLGVTWEEFRGRCVDWLEQNSGHPDAGLLARLMESENRMRFEKIKEVRNLIPTICGKRTPWEVCVGQSIAAIDFSTEGEHDLAKYLGRDLLLAIGLPQDLVGDPSSTA